jgi:lipoprotein-anchoring transpeptidase ErfK/SrfK
LSNEDMDDLTVRVEVGTPVTIVGTIPDGVLE